MPEDDSLEAASPEKKHRTWRVRWSLRALVVFVTLLCIPLTVVSVWMRQGYIHEDVAAKLQKLGGASVQWKFVEREYITVARPFASTGYREIKKTSDWLEAIGAAPVVQRIDSIYFRDGSPMHVAAFLDEVERLGSVKSVSIDQTPISEEQLAHLVDQLQMESLGVSETRIGRGSMPFLRDTNLKWISFHRTHFSDVAIDDLPESVEYLDATRTRITNEGLKKFVRLKKLKTLKLPRTPTTKEGIENLRRKMPWCEIQWRPLTHF